MKLNNLSKFFLIFAASYFILYGLHQLKPVRSFHNYVFITFEQLAFNLFHPTLKTDFDVYKPIEGVPYLPDSYDYTIKIYDKSKYRGRNSQEISLLNASLDKTSIAPILLFIALLIPTPRSWKSKLIIGLIGIFLIMVFIAMKYSFMFAENLESYPLKGLWGLLSKSFGGAFRSQEYFLLNIVFIWGISSLRMTEIKWFLK